MTSQPNMYVRIAAAVIAEAAGIDTRIRKGLGSQDALDRQIESWARVFHGQPIWPLEALEAVAEHYRNGDAFPIMPGNILEACKRQPVWSSPEHASWFLDRWAQHPWSTAIEEHTGMVLPELDPGSAGAGEKAELVARRQVAINARRQELVDAILRRRYQPRALEA